MKKISVLFLVFTILCLSVFSGCALLRIRPESTEQIPTTDTSALANSQPDTAPSAVSPSITEEEVRDYIDYLFETYPDRFLFCSETMFEQIQNDRLGDYYLPFFASDVSGLDFPTVEALTGKYATEYEADYLLSMQEGYDYSYNVYNAADLQQSFDALWGKGRINVKAWGTGGDSSMFITENGYILSAMLGYGDNGDYLFREISDIELTGDTAIISLYAIKYNYFDSSAADYATGRYLGNTFLDIAPDSSFDDVLSIVGTTREKLGLLEMTVKKGDGGLWLESGRSLVSVMTAEEFCDIYTGTWCSSDETYVGFGHLNEGGKDIPYFTWGIQDSGVFDGPGEIVEFINNGGGEYSLTVNFPEIDTGGYSSSAFTSTVLFIDPDIYDHQILVQHLDQPLMEYTLEDYYSEYSEAVG